MTSSTSSSAKASVTACHFVLNCASKSCLALLPRAERGESRVRVERGSATLPCRSHEESQGDDGTLELSAIFEWFRDDFVRDAGSVQAYVAGHWRGTPPHGEHQGPLPAYDWSLGSW
jgi:hypothetical protein